MIAITATCDRGHTLPNAEVVSCVWRPTGKGMRSGTSRQTPYTAFTPRLINASYPKSCGSFVLVLMLSGGWFVCTMRCATETAPECCLPRVESRPATATCEGHISPSLPQRQFTVTRQEQSLLRPVDGSPCCSCDAQEDGRAVLPRVVNNWQIHSNVPFRAAWHETSGKTQQISSFTPVMNRGSTYLQVCVLLI